MSEQKSEVSEILTWKKSSSRYTDKNIGYLGKYPVFEFFWNKISKEQKPYSLTCKLPGIKSSLGRFDSYDEAKPLAERALSIWIKGAGLTNVEDAP